MSDLFTKDKTTFTTQNGVVTLPLPDKAEDASTTYLTVREKEGRLLQDDDVARLPELKPRQPIGREFALRARSAQRLRHWLDQTLPTGRLLEIGCGNGWLLQYLTKDSDRTGVGLDINRPELEQAARVFGTAATWVLGDVFDARISGTRADAIIVASAVQYFENVAVLLDHLLELCTAQGAIHLLDTNWYSSRQKAQAEKRTQGYYEQLGTPEMAGNYHHHTLDELRGYRWKMLYHPQSLQNRLKRALGGVVSPFPWIVVRK